MVRRLLSGSALAAAVLAGVGLVAISAASPASPAPQAAKRPTAVPTPIPTPQAPPRIEDTRKGAVPRERNARFPGKDLSFSRILRVEEVDLDRDGVPEVMLEAIGTVQRLPEDVPAIGFVSRYRLPFESPLLVVLKKNGEEWRPLFIAHVPLRCGQSDDLSTCDQLLQFRTIRFRYDDRPQVVFQMLHPGDSGLNETYVYRLGAHGKLESTFSVSLPRVSVTVSVDPNGIERRLAVDTFVNRELPARYRSFTLRTLFVFGENRFRIASDAPEEAWSADRADVELAYWGLVHQPVFAGDVEKMRERQKQGVDAWALDPAEVIHHRFPDATKIRVATRIPGLCVVFFERPNNCYGHALLYQPVREWDGDRTFWEIGAIRGQKDVPFECMEEPPLLVGPGR
jgi:hypothetical protein